MVFNKSQPRQSRVLVVPQRGAGGTVQRKRYRPRGRSHCTAAILFSFPQQQPTDLWNTSGSLAASASNRRPRTWPFTASGRTETGHSSRRDLKPRVSRGRPATKGIHFATALRDATGLLASLASAARARFPCCPIRRGPTRARHKGGRLPPPAVTSTGRRRAAAVQCPAKGSALLALAAWRAPLFLQA